ncbi:MAG: sugar MFS transporter [Saprospiraceae bacterium]
MTYNKKTVFNTACVIMFTFGVSVICLGSILPEIVKKFGVDDIAAGVLASILPLGIMVGSLFCGPFADRNGYKGLFMLCCTLVMLGMEGLAFGDSWWMIQVAIFLIGAGGGALNSSASALVADISEGERGASLSILGIFYGLGALVLPSIIAALAAYFDAFTVIGGLGALILLVLILIAIVTFPAAKQQGGFPMKEALEMIKNPVLLLLGMVMFFQSGLEGLVSNWTNGFLQDGLQIDGKKALMGLTVHMAALTLMRVALGYLLKKYKDETVLNWCYGLMLAGVFIFWLGDIFALKLVALALLGAGFAGIFPIFLGMVGDKFAALSGTAFSIIFVIALIGNMIINYGMGLVSFQYGIQQMPIILVVCTVLMGGLLWRSKQHFN